MEEYKGIKFAVRRVEREIPGLDGYLSLDSKLGDFLDPQANEGNMSIRLDEGFLIKGSGARMTMLTAEDVSWVIGVDGEIIYAGATPSSETRMHHEIYRARADAGAILHFHDDKKLECFEGLSIGPFDYGTQEIALAAGKAAAENDIFMIKEHGFVIIAKSEEHLLQRLRSWKR